MARRECPTPGPRLAIMLGVLQAAVLLFLYLPAGLVVPFGPLILLNLFGVAFTLVGIKLARQGRRMALATPPVTAAFWLLYVTAGSVLFNWTA